MKRLFTLLMVAFVAFSCEMLDGALDSKGEGLTFAEGTETTATFKAPGGSATFKFTADLDWTVTTSDEWITVTPESGAAGEGEIKVKVAENDSEAERTAVIELRDKSGDTLGEITIVQRGKSAEDEEPGSEVLNNKIWYTTTDGMELDPYKTTGFGANLIDNAYVDGKGVLLFDGDVTTIGGSAFNGCSSLTSVTIGNDVTSIGYGAFYECSSLTSITIPDSVTTIGDYAFNSCTNLSSLDLGNGVESIGFAAFAYCDNLESVTIPDSVTTLSDAVFSGCSNIQQFEGKFAHSSGLCLIVDDRYIAFAAGVSDAIYEIPAGVTTIGVGAFQNTHNIAKIVVPDSVTEIGECAFDGCSSLTSIAIPDSVTTIGGRAFLRCSSLTSITIPDSVTTIGDFAFCECSSLESVYCKPTTPPSIEYDVFDDNASSRKIYVPAESVEAYKTAEGWSDYASSIVGYNFETGEVIKPTTPDNEIWYTTTDGMELDPYNTTRFGANLIDNTYVDGKGVLLFDGNVTTIGYNAFYRCSSLTSVTIPDSVTEIGEDAFRECSSLQSVTIGNSVTTIGEDAFWDCRSLTSITIPDSVTEIGKYAFYACSSLTEFKGDFASEDGRCLIIDGTLNSFAPAGVTKYTIPDSVTAIGESAFYGCSSLTSITISDSVTTIEEYAFSGCSSLTSVTIGNSVTEIGWCAFRWCSSLTSITIPNSVTTIGYGAFAGCSSLESVYCKPTTPPSIGDGVFNGNALGRKIYVPAESAEAYKTASYWSDYASDIVGYDF